MSSCSYSRYTDRLLIFNFDFTVPGFQQGFYEDGGYYTLYILSYYSSFVGSIKVF